jgi:iron complex outermembrane receptor protein
VKLKKLAHLIALIGVVGPAIAQEAAPQQPMQRVEITGSSIKRIAKEGALPVQIISVDSLAKLGINNAAELMLTLAANGSGANNATSSNNVFGPDADRMAGGANYASLRGLGASSTLVLLNGRRVSLYGKSGNAVDLNSIPMAAISRIEILKDGASAIYGTDAIGGVINFILKSDYQGVEVNASGTSTQAGGGGTRRASLLAGKGDLEQDGFNVMGSVSIIKNLELDSRQRAFANGFQPSRGLSPDTTGTPAANQLTGAGSALGSSSGTNAGFLVKNDPTGTKYLQAGLLSLQGKCNSVPGMGQYVTSLWPDVTSPQRTTYSCSYDYGGDYVMSSPNEQDNFLGRGTVKINANTKLFVEGVGSRSAVTSILTGNQISSSASNGLAYPVGGQYYQDLSAYIPSFDNTKPIWYKWRATPLGNRTMSNTTDSARLLVGLEGTLNNKWDYSVGLSKAQSSTKTDLLNGYAYTSQFYSLLNSGKIDMFSGNPQTAAVQDQINGTKFIGRFSHGKTTLTQLDARISSGELLMLPAGPLAVAAGIDLRREGYDFKQDVDATNILNAPGNPDFGNKVRDIKAVYAEAIIPVVKSVEIQAAIRRDDYSVIGATVNPKIGIRYEAAPWLLFRGSVNTGFLAPTFSQLYTPQLDQILSNGVIDTVGCAAHPGNATFCSPERLAFFSGGNPALKPQTSKQGTLGAVMEPFKGYSVSLDYWMINLKDMILNRTTSTVLANPVLLADNILRNQDGTINHVVAGWINAAGAKTRGLDLNVRGNGNVGSYKWTAVLDGTWTQSYQYAEIDGQPLVEYVGKFSPRDLYLRWKHNASVNVARGDWSVMLSNNYSTGYQDQLPDNGKLVTLPAGFNPKVSSYTTFNLSTTYTGIKNTTITAGIINLLDRDPPFTAHNVDDVVGAGWDPRVADPRGRTFQVNATYKF